MCVAMCCSVLRCLAVCVCLSQDVRVSYVPLLMCVTVSSIEWQCAAGCCSVLKCDSLCDAQTPCYDTRDCLALTSHSVICFEAKSLNSQLLPLNVKRRCDRYEVKYGVATVMRSAHDTLRL